MHSLSRRSRRSRPHASRSQSPTGGCGVAREPVVQAHPALADEAFVRTPTLSHVDLAAVGQDLARVLLAGTCSESPGETLTRLLLRALGLHEPQQQVELGLPGGGLARVDFLLVELGMIVEFDHAVTYGGVHGRDALVREKRREDGPRATGHEGVRLTWPDLRRPRHVHALLIAARDRACRLVDAERQRR